jgi:hypothetical protein
VGNQVLDGSDADWRLQGQEKYLTGVTLHHRSYFLWREDWDHDHCEFCWRKFLVPGDVEMDYSTRAGWATEDEYRWICDGCFADFRDRFHWKTREMTSTDRPNTTPPHR